MIITASIVTIAILLDVFQISNYSPQCNILPCPPKHLLMSLIESLLNCFRGSRYSWIWSILSVGWTPVWNKTSDEPNFLTHKYSYGVEQIHFHVKTQILRRSSLQHSGGVVISSTLPSTPGFSCDVFWHSVLCLAVGGCGRRKRNSETGSVCCLSPHSCACCTLCASCTLYACGSVVNNTVWSWLKF